MRIKSGYHQAKALGQYDFGVAESGNEYVQLTFSLVGGPNDGETIGWKGYFTDKTAQRTMEALRYCGWAGTDVTDLAGVDRNLVQLVIEDEEYEGKTYSRIKWVNRLAVSVKNRLEPAARAAFAAKMKGYALQCDPSLADGPRAEDAAKQPASSSHGDDPGFWSDDIPF